MHRDPVVLCASVVQPDHDIDADILGRRSQPLYRRPLDRYAHPGRSRKSMNSATPIPIKRSSMSITPISSATRSGTMRRVYASFGDELEGQALGAMTAHIESHPKGRFGKHGYNPEEFGLDAATIRDRFRSYIERVRLSRWRRCATSVRVSAKRCCDRRRSPMDVHSGDFGGRSIPVLGAAFLRSHPNLRIAMETHACSAGKIRGSR